MPTREPLSPDGTSNKVAEPAAPADGGRDPGFWDFNGLSCVQSAAETSTPLGQIQDGGPDRWRQAVPVRDQIQ